MFSCCCCCCCCWRMTSFLVEFMSGHKTINSIGLAYRTIKIRSFTSEMVKCRYSITWPPLVTHRTRGWKKGTPKFTRTPSLFEQINQMPRTKCQIRDSTRLISLSLPLFSSSMFLCVRVLFYGECVYSNVLWHSLPILNTIWEFICVCVSVFVLHVDVSYIERWSENKLTIDPFVN